jgi:phosphatidylglycerophosphatase A
MNRASTLIATLGGVGFAPLAPGTVASIAALPFAWLLMLYAGSAGLIIATIGVSALGLWACDSHSHASGETDPSECVIDELAGQWLACAFAPLSPGGFLLAFVLFRLFDILKPWPASSAERLHGGAGIMADDLVAGLMAGILVMGASAIWVL